MLANVWQHLMPLQYASHAAMYTGVQDMSFNMAATRLSFAQTVQSARQYHSV